MFWRPIKGQFNFCHILHASIASALDLNVLCRYSSHGPGEKEVLEGESEVEEEKEQGGKREKPVVRPEEIPPVPENRFLLRRDMPSQEDKTEVLVIRT